MFVRPVDPALDRNLKQLGTYLRADSARQLLLTGRYAGDETNFSAFPNLGLARANQVKNHMISLDVNPAQLSLAAALDDQLKTAKRDVLSNMVEFSVKSLNQDELTQEKLKSASFAQALKRKPMVLYFDEGEASIQLTHEQRSQLLGIVAYMDKNVDAQLVIIGHTDSKGSKISNIVLGRERAQYVANFLQTNGLDTSRFVVSSLGKAEPIADNSTQQGQQKNRRVVVTLN